MNWHALPHDREPDRQASLIEAATAARQGAASARANALGCRLNIHRQRHRRNRTLETSNATIHHARETCANSRRSYHFGLDWQEPDGSLDNVLLVHEP